MFQVETGVLGRQFPWVKDSLRERTDLSRNIIVGGGHGKVVTTSLLTS